MNMRARPIVVIEMRREVVMMVMVQCSLMNCGKSTCEQRNQSANNRFKLAMK